MGSPYLEVVRTYFLPWHNKVTGAFFALFLVLCWARPGLGHDMPVFILLVFPFFVSGLCEQMKEHFVNPGGRIVPGYARIHLTTAAVVSLIVCLLVTGAIVSVNGATLLGSLAVVVTVYTVLLWIACSRVLLRIMFPILCLCWMGYDKGVEPVWSIVTCRLPSTTALMLLASVTALIVLGFKFVSLKEASFAELYGSFTGSIRPPEATPAEAQGTRCGRILAAYYRFVAQWEDHHLARVLSKPTEGLLHDVRRLRAVAGHPTIGFTSMVTTVVYATIAATLLFQPANAPRVHLRAMDGIAFVGVTMTLLLMLLDWREVVRKEWLRPIGRRPLFRLLRAAVLMEAAEGWLGFCAGIVLCWAIREPWALRELASWAALIMTGGFFWSIGGGVMCFLTFPSRLERFVLGCAWVVAINLCATVPAITGDGLPSGLLLMLYGAVMAVLGLALSLWAHHWWLEADWD